MAGQFPAGLWRIRSPWSQWERKIRVEAGSFAGKGSNCIAGWNFCALQRIEERETHGKWDDQWVVHPLPTLNEPEKAVCWLTPDETLHENRVADLYLRSGLARIDNVFQKTRRLFNAFERPIGTSSTHNKVWHGYAPYNPGMTEKYLTIFRAVNNFVFVGDDGMTPAMRLGFTKAPLGFEDLLWPGQPVPQPRGARRRGKKAVAA